MICFERVWAVVIRHLYIAFRDMHRLIWMFYWPMLDIILWGFTGMWMQSNQTNPALGQALLTGLVFWQIVSRANFEISMSLMDELWSLNMVNMFASPLKAIEWVMAVVLLGLIACSVLMAYCTALVYLFYQINIFSMGLKLAAYIFPFFVSGLWAGFIAATIVIYYGARAQSLVFVIAWVLAPFCGVFYPLEVLPYWAQKIAYIFPMTYLFVGIRELVLYDIFNTNYIWMGLGLSILYGIITLYIFLYAFEKSKEKGFSRLSAE